MSNMDEMGGQIGDAGHLIFDGVNFSAEFLVALRKFLATYQSTPTSFPGNITISGNLNVVGIYKQNGTSGANGTIPLAKLTSLGTQGSLTVSNGIITAYVSPT